MRINYRLMLIVLLILLVGTCRQDKEKRKIKLSNQSTISEINSQMSSTIYLEPALRRAVAVLFFENKTGDHDLEWLQKGLTEMFIRTLSQSQNLKVLGIDRLHEIIDRLGKTESAKDFDIDMAAIVAREAKVKTVLTGNILKSGDSLQINVKVYEAAVGRILKEVSVEGSGLENLFTMVDDLTRRIKNDMQISINQEQDRGITDLSTNSLAAWRYYTNGMDFLYQFLLATARDNFNMAVNSDSSFIAAYLPLCQILLNDGETDQMNKIFQKLLTLRNKATDQEKYQIDLFDARLKGNIQKIMDLSKQWLNQFADDRDANINLAEIYYGRQDYNQAIQYYNKVVEIDPQFKNAYNTLGYCYANIGDYDKAIQSMKKYIIQAPAEPNPYDSMGEIYSYKGDFKNAEKQFKKANKLNENLMFSRLHLGNVYLDKGEYKKALKQFQKSLEKASGSTEIANVHTNIGLTQWRLGKNEEAIINLKKSLEYRDNQYLVMTWLNDIYKDQNDSAGREKALQKNYELIKQSTKIFPACIYTLANMSLWYDINVEETIDVIDNVLKTTDNQIAQMWGSFFLALLYLRTNQLEKFDNISQEFTEKFAEILKVVQDVRLTYSFWRNFNIYNRHVYQFLNQGLNKYDQLISFCRQNKLKSTEMVFRSYLADLYFKTGNMDSALIQFKKAGIPEENKWLVIGPFEHKNGFNKKFPPEKEFKLDKKYHEKSNEYIWQHANDSYFDGYIDLQEILKQYNWSVGYGLIYVKSPVKKDAQFRVGTNDATKIWLNEKLVWNFNQGRDAIFDDDIFNVSLEPGLNKILIKICNRINLWGFYFRITDATGNGFSDVEFLSADDI